jgi:hypothetical protein
MEGPGASSGMKETFRTQHFQTQEPVIESQGALVPLLPLFSFFLVVLELELRVLSLLGRCFTV